MTEDSTGDTSREEKLHEVLAAYYEAAENGDDPDRRILIDRHPELAAELADFFAVQDDVHHMAVPLRAMVSDGPDTGEESEPNVIDLICSGIVSMSSAVGTGLEFGDYELQGVIARGGMGIVFRARQRSLNRLVALKVIRDGARASDDDARRFRNEAEAVARLDHPHIVPIYEVGEEHGCSFFTMKLVEGGNLAERLTDYQGDQRAAAQLTATIARAVHHAHERGILHRDLKPSNILIDERGQPLVADFGLARRLEGDSELTQTGAVLGTPGYMAPEQAKGRRGTVTKVADVYGLGAILYALLTGRPPFRGETPLETLQQVKEKTPEPPSTTRQSIDRDLETICLKCLEKEPGRRYGSALAVAEDLERWRAGQSILARPVGRAERVWRLCRRNRRMSGLAAAMLLLLVVGVAGLIGASRARQAAARLSEEVRRHAQEERSRQYVRDVKRASQLWAENRPAQARELLDRYRRARGQDDLRGFAWNYFHRICSIRPEVLSGHRGEVYFAVLSPDGQTLATVSQDRTSRLWDLETRTTRWTLVGHGDEINWVSFSPDGRTVATASDDQSVKLWDAATGRNKSTLTGHSDRVVSVLFTPDGRQVVSCSRKGELIVWNAETLQKIGPFAIPNGTLQSMAISPDGHTLALAGERVVIWSTTDLREVTRLEAHKMQVNCASFSHDGKRLATAGKDGTVRLWLTAGWHLEATFAENQAEIESVTFAPDDQTLASVDRNGVIHLWNRASGAKDRIASGEQTLWSVAFCRDGRNLATTSKQGTVKLWDVVRSRTWIPINLSTTSVAGLAFSPDGQAIVVADDRGSVSIHDTRDGHLISVRQFHDGRPHLLTALSHDGRLLVTGGHSGRITFWDLASGHRLRECTAPQAGSGPLTFSPNSKWLAQADQERVVVLWDVASGESRRLEGTVANHPTFSPRGDCFTMGGWGSSVPTVWDLATAVPRTTSSEGHRININVEAFSPDGAALATGGADGKIILWDVKSLDRQFALYGHAADVWSLAFSPDGRTLFSGGDDRLVHIWDLPSQTEIATLVGHSGVIRNVCSSGDGSILASCAEAAGGGSEVFLWRATAADAAPSLP